ncbi:MAG: LysR family transcriptional regulator, partial [Paracoccaceae bacterium]
MRIRISFSIFMESDPAAAIALPNSINQQYGEQNITSQARVLRHFGIEKLMNDRRMPPLNALRAFEAAARHLSLKEAADELCVTPGAISQSIKTLEQALGIELFQ